MNKNLICPTSMSDHDEMCPCFPDCASAACTKCRCEEYARVRANEKQRIIAELIMKNGAVQFNYDHDGLSMQNRIVRWLRDV